MIDELRFIAGAVAKKDYVEELTHVRIRNGWIQSFNGTVSAACKIALDINVMPLASSLINAIRACDETVALSITKTGKLSIKSGSFRCFVKCLEPENEDLQMFPTPEGDFIEVTPEFMESLKTCAPFMATDASRPWAMGVIFTGKSAYATNNVMLIQHWHGIDLGVDVTIPAEAVNELLRRREEPTHIQVSDSSLTVWFGRDKWFRTQLLVDQFPETLPTLLEATGEPPIPVENYPGFFEAIEKLRPFVDEASAIHVMNGALSTTGELHDDGASVAVDNLVGDSCWHFKHLLLLKDVAVSIDLTQYPKPARFLGHNKRVRGIFMGLGITNAG